MNKQLIFAMVLLACVCFSLASENNETRVKRGYGGGGGGGRGGGGGGGHGRGGGGGGGYGGGPGAGGGARGPVYFCGYVGGKEGNNGGGGGGHGGGGGGHGGGGGGWYCDWSIGLFSHHGNSSPKKAPSHYNTGSHSHLTPTTASKDNWLVFKTTSSQDRWHPIITPVKTESVLSPVIVSTAVNVTQSNAQLKTTDDKADISSQDYDVEEELPKTTPELLLQASPHKSGLHVLLKSNLHNATVTD